MIHKALFIGLLVLLAAGGAAVAFLTTYENEFYELVRLKKECERIPEAQRKARAKEVAERLFHRHESLQSLSFTLKCTNYWDKEGTLLSHLPLRWWPKVPVARFSFAMAQTSQRTEVAVGGKPVHAFFLDDGKVQEFKWPHGDIPGMRTEYTIGADQNRWDTRLGRGIDPSVLCVAGKLRFPWLVPDIYCSGSFMESMGAGLWLGVVCVGGEDCDVVLWERAEVERWDAFYVNRNGLLLMWAAIQFRDDRLQRTLIRMHRYTNIVTDSIPPSALSPSSDLLEEAKAWRALSDAESLDEFKAVNGE